MPKKAWGGNLSTELLTVEQVADILHVTVDTVRIYIRNKELPAFKVGRSYLVRRGDVDRFLEKRRSVDGVSQHGTQFHAQTRRQFRGLPLGLPLGSV